MTTVDETQAPRILILDDDPTYCTLVVKFLEPHGYSVDSVQDPMDGLRQILTGVYRAVILDVMMPGMDGFEVLKRLRRESEVPVIMLTSRGDEIDRIVGLEIGADDYLPKTSSPRELLARLRAVLRRSSWEPGGGRGADSLPLISGPIRVEEGSRQVWLHQDELNLTRAEFDLLLLLLNRRGRVVSRDILMEEVAGREYGWQDRSVDVLVSSLRRKLGDDPKDPRFIRTIRSVGYLFIEPDGADA